MVLDEAGIRLLRRPQDADPLERDTAAGGVEHGPHGVADLVVGVGRRHDRDQAFRRGTGVDDGLAAQEDRVVFDEVDVDPLAERIDELERESGEVDRQMHHDMASVGDIARGHETCRLGEEVGLVVPRVLEAAGDGSADPNRILCSPGGRGEPSRGSRPGEADLVVNAAEGDDGGGMTRDVAEHAGLRLEDLGDGEFDQRRRHR